VLVIALPLQRKFSQVFSIDSSVNALRRQGLFPGTLLGKPAVAHTTSNELFCQTLPVSEARRVGQSLATG
jgi:hypothetical protein